MTPPTNLSRPKRIGATVKAVRRIRNASWPARAVSVPVGREEETVDEVMAAILLTEMNDSIRNPHRV